MKRIPTDTPKGQAITVDLEGESIPAFEGEPVACSLLAAGEKVFARSIKYHRPRAPYCFAAACSHCLMRVDGVPNIYTCRTPAKAGMKLLRQNAYPSAKVDVFNAIDWLFPKGLDHHAMFAGVPVADVVMAKVARHLAGLGTLPASPAPPRLPAITVNTRVAIAGGGLAGVTVAAQLAKSGVSFQLFEREQVLGGRLVVGAVEPRSPTLPTVSFAGNVRMGAWIIGLFDDEHGRYLAVVQDMHNEPRLIKAYADAFVIAVGGYPELLPFENNDLPGVFAGRAVSALIRRHGVVPGNEIVVAGRGAELFPLAQLIEKSGAKVPLIVQLEGELPAGAPATAVVGEVLKAHGRGAVTALSVMTKDGKKKISCDAVALSLPPAPSFELARQAGAKVSFHEGHHTFVIEADADGQTQAKGIFVAGDAAGPKSAAEAAAMAVRVGDRVARSLS